MCVFNVSFSFSPHLPQKSSGIAAADNYARETMYRMLHMAVVITSTVAVPQSNWTDLAIGSQWPLVSAWHH